MRMRKKKWAAGLLEARDDVMIYEPSGLQGKWKTIVLCDVLHVEIGTGKGDYWLTMAHQYPQEGWIGIERNTDVAAIALKKAADAVLPTMKLIRASAEYIDEWFAPQEVDVLHLNFSDPWPKKAHAKRRLTAPSFLKKYDTLLAHDGTVQLKTDNSGFFEYSLLSFLQEGWILQDVWVDYRREEHPEDAITEYERSYMEKGQPIYRAVFAKAPKEAVE